MSDEPAEEEEIFQYEMVKAMRKMNKTLERIANSLEQIEKKMKEDELIHP
jgi:uncharacterized protein YukE